VIQKYFIKELINDTKKTFNVNLVYSGDINTISVVLKLKKRVDSRSTLL